MAAKQVLVIGAGMAGLTAATLLDRSGVDTVVIDKGRAPGGRMATRTVDGARFDHGAQHFGARSPAFREAVAQWISDDVAGRWFTAANNNADGTPNVRHVGVNGMRRIPERMARELDVRLGVAITELRSSNGGVLALAGSETVAEGGAVIVTAPVPQTLTLLDASGLEPPVPLRSQLANVSYNATLAIMAHLNAPAGLTDGHLSPVNGPIAWIADNQHKGTSASPAVTIHSTAEFAEQHLEEEPPDWIPILAGHAADLLGAPLGDTRGHRWRYSEPQTTLNVGAACFVAEYPVVLAGEVFSGAKVEGAFLSGLAAAEQVLEVV